VFRAVSVCRHAVATTPAEPRETCRSPLSARGPALSPRRRPSLFLSQVGFRVARFEACSAFTRVTACMLAESSYDDPFHRRLRRFRCLPRRSDCYRLERPLAGWELHPL